MKWTLEIGKLFGVRIRIHWTFFLLLFWIVFVEYNRTGSAETIFYTTLFIIAIFTCVVFHEMGHILMARRYDVKTSKITLLPIGGVASMEKMPENPRQEMLVALAGPFVNVVIAAIIFLFLGDLNRFLPGEGAENLTASISASNFWFSLMVVNVVLVAFNLIPAFPMDGGRVLRALLAMKMGRLQATNIASLVGQVLAVGFFFIGLFINPLLLLIGVFIFFGARGENYMVQQSELMRGHLVSEAMVTNFDTIDMTKNINEIQHELISSGDDLFVATDNGSIKGIIKRKDILEALRNNEMDTPVSQLVRTDFDTIQSTDKLSKVLPLIRQHGQSAFPVIDGKELKGIISLDSIQRFLSIQGSLSY